MLKKRKNLFNLSIPELYCNAKDEDLREAYKKLEIEKEKYFQKMIELNCEHEIKRPKVTKSNIPILTNVYLFLIKFLIVLFIGSMVILVGYNKLLDRTKSYIRLKAESIFNEFVNMPEDKIEDNVQKLHKVIEKVKPLIDEFRRD